MPRGRSGGGGRSWGGGGSRSPPPARAPPPRAAPPPPPPPPPPAAAAPAKAPGLFAQMAATAGGVAIGSTVGHVVGHALTSGGDKEQPQQAPPAEAQAPPQPLYASPGQQMYADGAAPPPAGGGSLENSPCGDHLKSLLMCTQSQPDISYCTDISEALKQCRNYYGKTILDTSVIEMLAGRWKMLLSACFVLAFVRSPSGVEAEFFSAVGEMRTLIDHQNAFVHKLDNYVEGEEKRLDLVKKYLATVESRFGGPQGPPIAAITSIDADTSSLISNPLNAFLLIKYLSKDWGHISGALNEDAGSEFLTQLANDSSIRTPTFDDYKGAVSAIMRLQETYHVDAKTFADGTLFGHSSTRPMSSADCFNFGRSAYLEKDWVLTVSWMKEAFIRETSKETPDRDFLSDILDHLAYSTSKTGNYKAALHWAEELFEVNPAQERVEGYLHYFKRQLQTQIQTRGRRGDAGDERVVTLPEDASLFDRDFWVERRKYQALCRGDRGAIKLTPRRESKLKCKLFHGNKPRLLLSPAKVEEVFDKPRLVVFHDILRENEIEEVLTMSSGRLRRATARNARTGQFEPADYRISKSTWLGPSTSRTVRSIFERVSDITNLDMQFSEDLQVNNYGIGGMYDPHYDFARDHESAFKAAYGDNRGNRIATVLFYFTDVEAGGATVFPTVGASVKPSKGSAVFWYNLLPSGEGDLLTRHAGCPVLVGSKWVANFWIHEGGQEFRRRCRLNRHARR